MRQRRRKNKYEKAHNWNNECLLPSAAKYVTSDIQLQKVMWNTAGQSREGVRMENNFSSSSYLHWSKFCPRKHQVSYITSFLIWVPSSFPGKPQGGRWVTVPSWRWWVKQYLERAHIEQIIAVHLGKANGWGPLRKVRPTGSGLMRKRCLKQEVNLQIIVRLWKSTTP